MFLKYQNNVITLADLNLLCPLCNELYMDVGCNNNVIYSLFAFRQNEVPEICYEKQTSTKKPSWWETLFYRDLMKITSVS